MAATVSITAQPFTYSVVNAEMWYQFDSLQSGNENFNYIAKLNKINPSNGAFLKDLGTYKVPPRPDSFGLYSPNNTLKSEVSYNINPFILTASNATQSIVHYNLYYGCEFDPNLVYTNTFKTSFGFLGLSFSNDPGISIGDIITIDKDNKSSNPQYDGTSSVTGVINIGSTHVIELNKIFITSSVSDAGQIINLVSYTGTSSTKYAFNGTRQYDERTYDFGDSYVQKADNGSYRPLTSYFPLAQTTFQDPYNPVNKTIYLDQYETLSYLLQPNSYTFSATIAVFDGGFAPSGFYSFTYSVKSARVDIPSGTKNLVDMGVPITMTTNRYYVETRCDNFPSSKFVYDIIGNCSPYNNYRIAFLNRFGAFDYWNFNWKNTNSYAMERTEFKKVLPWNYNIGDRQDSILSQKVNQSVYVSSDWLTEEQAEYLKELMYSPEVYVVQEADPHNFYPIIITTNTYNTKTKLNDKLFAISFEFRYAYDINTQNQ